MDSTPATPPSDPDAADLLRFAAGDGAALEGLIARAVPRAYAQAHRRLGNSADAEDAVQEAMLRLVRSAERYRGDVPFAAWLGRLVQAAAADVGRTRRRRLRDRTDAPKPAAASAAHDDGEADAVRAAVAALPARYRMVVELHYFAGLGPAEVASALDVSTNVVAVRLHRARERLRADLSRREPTTAAAVTVALGSLAHASPAPSAAMTARLTAAMHAAATAVAAPAVIAAPTAVVIALSLAIAASAVGATALARSTRSARSVPIAQPQEDRGERPVPAPLVDRHVLFAERFALDTRGWIGAISVAAGDAAIRAVPADGVGDGFFAEVRTPLVRDGWRVAAGTWLRFRCRGDGVTPREHLKLMFKRRDGLNYGGFPAISLTARWQTVAVRVDGAPFIPDHAQALAAGEILTQLAWLVFSETRPPAGASVLIDDVELSTSASAPADAVALLPESDDLRRRTTAP